MLNKLYAAILFLAVSCGSAWAAPMSHAEFTAQFSPLVGGEEHADLMLSLCDKALSEVAADNLPYISTANAYKSHAYWLKQDYAKAEESARAAIKADPKSALAHFMLTDALYALEQFDAARSSCFEATDNMNNPQHQGQLRGLCEESYTQRKAAKEESAALVAPQGKDEKASGGRGSAPGPRRGE